MDIGTRLIRITKITYEALLEAQRMVNKSQSAIIYALLNCTINEEEFFEKIKEYEKIMKEHRYSKRRRKNATD
jgi:hypothetical protein